MKDTVETTKSDVCDEVALRPTCPEPAVPSAFNTVMPGKEGLRLELAQWDYDYGGVVRLLKEAG